MIFHLSMPAENPARVAAVIAEIWDGECLPFPPVEGAYIAMAGDDRGSMVEVYPRAVTLHPGAGDGQVEAWLDAPALRNVAVHAAIATALTEAEVKAIGLREGWTCKTLSRGGAFSVVEFWVENAFLLEVLTADMQADYTSRMTIQGWRATMAEHRPI